MSAQAFDIAFYERRRRVKFTPEDAFDAPVSDWIKAEDGTLTRAKAAHLTPRKRSIMLNGKRTSIIIQDGLWQELNSIAARRGVRKHQLISEIEANRKAGSLSAAVRRFVFLQMDH